MGARQARFFSSFPDHTKVEMPNLSPTMEKGNIGQWYIKEGDKIAPGDVLCSVETDKATVDFEMQDEGYIAKILYDAGSKDIPLGTALAIMVDDEDDVAAFKDYKDEGGAAPAAPSAPAAEAAPAQAAPTPTPAAAPSAPSGGAPAKPSGSRIFASPLAQNAANAQGVNLASIQGTGPGGRIIKADIDDALASGSGQTSSIQTPVFDSVPSGFIDLENSNIRKVIADRLTYSKQNIPHYYVTVQVGVDNLLALRGKLNKHATTKISVNDFVIKAASMAAVKVPMTNSSWMGDFIR